MPGRPPPPSNRPAFECLAFAVEPRPHQEAAASARQALHAAFGPRRWQLTPLTTVPGEFLAHPRGAPDRPRRVSPARAWSDAYRLRDQPQVRFAEPLFTVADHQQHPPAAGRRARSVGMAPDPRTEGRFEWPLQTLRVRQAWARFGRRRPGAGVRVAQPDTGYTPHPAIAGRSLRPDLGYDFQDGDGDPRDELSGGLLRTPGHGTATASVIIGTRGAPTEAAPPPVVTGIAPGASLIPIRTTESVVLWSMERLVRAVDFAVSRAHVISISLGGVVPSRALHRLVQAAEADGIIVLCAAGNQVRFVVFPAAFDEVIAVAASDIGDAPWIGSSRGPAVDITAPGHSVYRARVTRNAQGVRYDVERSSGTSFAVAAAAGVAALWLSFHGRSALIARYGRSRLAAVFRRLLQDAAQRPAGWDVRSFGSGLVDALALMDAPLPADAPARGLRGQLRRGVSIDDLPLERLVHLLMPAPRSAVVRALAALLAVGEDALPARLGEIGDELTFRLAVDARLRRRLVAAATAGRGRSARARSSWSAVRRALADGASRKLRSALPAR